MRTIFFAQFLTKNIRNILQKPLHFCVSNFKFYILHSFMFFSAVYILFDKITNFKQIRHKLKEEIKAVIIKK